MCNSNGVRHRSRLYKGMALEVGVRNPERYFGLLTAINNYEGQVLNDECILNIYAEFYRMGLVSSHLLGDDDLENMTDDELKQFIRDNDHHNNEWGFPTGYQAGFTRYLKTLSEFGFIYTQYNQTILISPVAKSWLNGDIDTPTAFSLQAMRFWRKSPYRRVLNDFNYFSFILKVLLRLGEENRRLSYPQFVLSLYSDCGSVDDFIGTINDNHIGNDLHAVYNYIVDHYSNVDRYHAKVPREETVTRDYADSVFRVLRLTGLISVENNGMLLISINEEKEEFLNYLLTLPFSLTEGQKENELEYFKALGSYSDDLKAAIDTFREEPENQGEENYNNTLNNIIRRYDLNEDRVVYLIRKLCNNTRIRRETDLFWFMDEPLKLEFYVTLLLYMKYGNAFDITPHYKYDTDGIPYEHAPGNVGDILVSSEDVNWLIEVTLIRTRRQQYNDETANCIRHFRDIAQHQRNYLSFVAPLVCPDTNEFYENSLINMIRQHDDNLYLKPYNVNEFIAITLNQNNIEDMTEYRQTMFDDMRRAFGGAA